MKDRKPEIQKLIADQERHFIFNPGPIQRHGTDEFAEKLSKEYFHLKTYVLDGYEQINDDEAKELLDNIENKLAVDENLAGSSEYWWTPATPNSRDLLRRIKRILDRDLKPAKSRWARIALYSREVVVGGVYIFFVVTLFSVATRRFETVIIAGLVLIYNLAVRALRGLSMSHSVSMTAQLRILGEIARHLRIRVPVQTVADLERRAERDAIHVWIELAFLGLGSLIALCQLAKAIWF